MLLQLRRLVIAVVLADTVVGGACLVACALVGAFSREGLGSALFVAGLVMAFLGSAAGQSPLRLALPLESGRSQMAASVVQNQVSSFDPQTTLRRVQDELGRLRNTSWTAAMLFGGVPLVVVGIGLILL